jgi:hypothetical protein
MGILAGYRGGITEEFLRRWRVKARPHSQVGGPAPEISKSYTGFERTVSAYGENGSEEYCGTNIYGLWLIVVTKDRTASECGREGNEAGRWGRVLFMGFARRTTHHVIFTAHRDYDKRL